jgi:hypothetical protein
MEWVPDEAWLTKIVVSSDAGELDFDLAIDASGAGRPSATDAGYAPFGNNPVPAAPVALYLLLAAMMVITLPIIFDRWVRGASRTPPFAGA